MPRPRLVAAPPPVLKILGVVATSAAAPIHKAVLRAERVGRNAEDHVRLVTATVARDLAACPPSPQHRQSVRLRLTRAQEALRAAQDAHAPLAAARDALNAKAYQDALTILPEVESLLRTAFGTAARSAIKDGSPLPEQWLALVRAREHYTTCVEALESIRPPDAPPIPANDYLTALPVPPDLQA